VVLIGCVAAGTAQAEVPPDTRSRAAKIRADCRSGLHGEALPAVDAEERLQQQRDNQLYGYRARARRVVGPNPKDLVDNLYGGEGRRITPGADLRPWRRGQ